MNSSVCKIRNIFPGTAMCRKIWAATQYVLKNIVGLPDSCQAICNSLTSKWTTTRDLALAFNVTQAAAKHQVTFRNETRELFHVIFGLIAIIIVLTGVLITCHVAQCRRRITRRKRRDETIKSLQRRFQYRPYGGSYSLPDVQQTGEDGIPPSNHAFRRLINNPENNSNVRDISFRYRDGRGRGEDRHPSNRPRNDPEHERFVNRRDISRSPSPELD